MNDAHIAVIAEPGNWLYPLSSHSDWHFVDEAGVDHLATFSSFQAMVRSSKGEHFRLATNFKQVQTADRVWMYYGVADGGQGVVGLGIIDLVEPYFDGTPAIRFTWDRRSTEALLSSPVAAGKVRWEMQRPPRAAVQNLAPYPRLVKLLEATARIA